MTASIATGKADAAVEIVLGDVTERQDEAGELAVADSTAGIAAGIAEPGMG